MSAEDLITAYKDLAIPHAQEQDLPGLDKNLAPGVEYSKIENWHDGKPVLEEYEGARKLENKTAIITGGDSGIGRSAAIMFARECCRGISICYLPDEETDAQEAKKQIEASGAEVLLHPLDLMESENCRKLVEDHMKHFGSLDVLVNNASKQILCKNIGEIDLETVESTFKSNIISMFAVSKFAVPHMKRGSAIVNTTSVTAYKGSSGMVDYSATKGAITTFTRSLAVQLAPKGIRVNGVAPGPVMTALQAASRPAENMEGLGLGLPLHGRIAQPAELGPTFVYLANSRDSNVVTGSVVHINSGQHIGGS